MGTIYLGLGWVYAGYVVAKMLVIIGAHSDVAWDRPLYAIRWLSPLMWVVERTISTPATHHAHHGRHAEDPAVHYKGNYGNLLFLWDVIFRRACAAGARTGHGRRGGLKRRAARPIR